MTWVNKGQNVHTATSDQGVNPAWDSGGLGNNQSFAQTFQFAKPGTYTYHSETDVRYDTDPNDSTKTIKVFLFTATIVIQ